MGALDLGPWTPMPVAEAVERFSVAGFRWWLSGGHALEAHVGRSWRDHDDTDIGICRSHAPLLLGVLDGWDIHVGTAGALTQWDGLPLHPDRSGNNLWCRPTPGSPWALDITLGDGDDHEWIYRRDPHVRRPWAEAVLTTLDGVPYLAPELQLLFKSEDVRPKDVVDAMTVIPELEAERRSWLANHLCAEHPWQTVIAGTRARVAIERGAESGSEVELMSAGRSSRAWRVRHADEPRVVRVPIPNSGRVISYRSEVLLGRLLADAGHPVATWQLAAVDDLECSIGTLLDGTPVEEGRPWPAPFTGALATLLRALHRLPAAGWGPLENRTDQLRGTSPSANQGIIDRWFHAPVWPFDPMDLDTHPIADLQPELLPRLAALEAAIVDAATAPFGVVHSDLHRQHLLHIGDELAGVLDFGDAFIGSTAWDFALLHWYHGADNTNDVARAYQPGSRLAARGALLAVAVGCYKIAKTPDDQAPTSRLGAVLDALPTEASRGRHSDAGPGQSGMRPGSRATRRGAPLPDQSGGR